MVITTTNAPSAGRLYGVGVGPGDPELLTLKALRILREVERIFHPAGANGSVAARVLTSLDLEHKLHGVALCMSRERSSDENAYGAAARAIVECVERGERVAWISEGDPSLYSTFLHLRAAVLRLAPQTAMEIVPGVASMQAAAARAGLPLARLHERVTIVPAAYGIPNLPTLLEECATVVLLKVHSSFDRLLDALAGMPGRVTATYVEKVGMPGERIVTRLESLRGQDLPYFSLVILRRED